MFQRKRWFAKRFFICSLSFLFIIAENFSRNNASEECGEQNPRNNSCVKAEQKEHCYGKRFFHCDTEKSCRYDCRTKCRVKSAEHCNTVADAHSAEDDGEEVTAFPTRLYADVCENKFKHTAYNENPRCKFGKAFLDNGNAFFARKHCEGEVCTHNTEDNSAESCADNNAEFSLNECEKFSENL